MSRVLLRISIALLLVLSASAGTVYGQTNSYTQTNLVSDTPGVAHNTDPNLINPWGIAFSGSGPFWVADNVTGLSTVMRLNKPGQTCT